MQTFDSVEIFAWMLEVAGCLILYLQLWRKGLRHTYRFFSAYLLYNALASIPPVLLPRLGWTFGLHSKSDLYAVVWMASEPIFWLLYILIVLELYGLVLQKYKGIASLGRWAVLAGLGVAILIAAVTLSADFSNAGEKFPILRMFLAIHRGVASSLVIFLLFIIGFLVWYPVPLSRNVVVHSAVYAVYFFTMTLALLVRNLAGAGATTVINITESCIGVLCLLVWLRYLTPEGERETVRVGQRWDPDQAERLVEQLATINSTLLGPARK